MRIYDSNPLAITRVPGGLTRKDLVRKDLTRKDLTRKDLTRQPVYGGGVFHADPITIPVPGSTAPADIVNVAGMDIGTLLAQYAVNKPYGYVLKPEAKKAFLAQYGKLMVANESDDIMTAPGATGPLTVEQWIRQKLRKGKLVVASTLPYGPAGVFAQVFGAQAPPAALVLRAMTKEQAQQVKTSFVVLAEPGVLDMLMSPTVIVGALAIAGIAVYLRTRRSGRYTSNGWHRRASSKARRARRGRVAAFRRRKHFRSL